LNAEESLLALQNFASWENFCLLGKLCLLGKVCLLEKWQSCSLRYLFAESPVLWEMLFAGNVDRWGKLMAGKSSSLEK
jgi:hypothetical protein